ncbi:YycH family regulatory protein [Aquisalibacillus elongatus]|uniref:Regulatory protein YycH of two-component signal transduction system YycFG n=1 Tax=Aquisalibacillus elongatus TaxID=485577 RepID=A0A3N5B0L3_9BACI|nr:two-component system activity regulator YycH [Aquisalibacillus elongatus]RPF51106.1 regulatory protein YycH of two-component signal transduction system YycFG [Aquisalibacillus elongatus]
MNLENIKSLVLFLLVLFSLFLTFALWTYQPQFDELEQRDYLDRTKLDGQEQSISEVIYPNEVIFHHYNQAKKLLDKEEETDFYSEMTSWEISKITSLNSSNQNVLNQFMQETDLGLQRNNLNESIELHFPDDLPMELIPQMFNVSDVTGILSGSFNKMYLHLDSSAQDIKILFLSDRRDEEQIFVGNIQSSDVYAELEGQIDNRSKMMFLSRYPIGNKEFYLPNEEESMPAYTLTTEDLDLEPLKNVLFNNPSLIRRTSSALDESSHHTDGNRALKTYSAFNYNEFIVFINPLSNEQIRMNPDDLVNRSIEFTNDHTGWTDEYKLSKLSIQPTNTLTYRMYYNGYPVFDSSQYTIMEQDWGDNGLYRMKRPLFKISQEFSNAQEKRMDSGEQIYQSLQSIEGQVSLDLIEEFRLGYKLSKHPDVTSQVMTLEPSWYIKYQGTWEEYNSFTSKYLNQGVE